MKVIVIGGVAAGMSCAAKISRMDKSAEVTVYEKGNYLSYGACGLPYYVAGYNDDPMKMIARTREQFEKAGIHTRLRHEVLRVDTAFKKITVRDLETGREFDDPYDKLMIAVGAEAIKPPIGGIDKKGIHVLKTLENGMELQKAASQYGVRNVTVVGGGYIGIEVVEAMLALGKRVTCIEAQKRILLSFDDEIASLAAEHLLSRGVELREGEKVLEFTGGVGVNGVTTDRGFIETDLVIVSAGVRPATQFLQGSGIETLPNGAVVVDRQMRASVPDVYSAGDCATVYDAVKNKNVYTPLATVANKCGRIAGTNICGGGEEFMGSLGSSAIKVCDIELGRTGMSEREAIEAGYRTGVAVVDVSNHPAYYPDPKPIRIKLIYEKNTKRILGAQLGGGPGAALRADIFAVAIHAGMTADQLGMSDLVYAPPFSGVWDAVHIACNAAK